MHRGIKRVNRFNTFFNLVYGVADDDLFAIIIIIIEQHAFL